jgi:hypothetical protein
MSTLKALYGSVNQAITITLTSLANQAYRQSASVDNSSNLFLDALVTVKVKGNSSGVSGTGYVTVFAYGSTDGSSFDGSASGTDAAYTPPSTPPNLAYLGTVNITGNSVVDQRTFSIAQGFGGTLPQAWGIIVYNSTGAALDASVGSAWYQGIQAQTV